jgi:hypothetical protein
MLLRKKKWLLYRKIKQSIVDFVERSDIIEKIQGFIDYILNLKMQGKF